MLCNHTWKFKYTPDDGDLVKLFYIPALKDAERYDRLTGYFNAHALTLAARGIEGLVRNDGRMRLVVGCTLDNAEIKAIEKGERLRDLVERKLKSLPLTPPDSASYNALELLAWMIGRGHLDVKVAVPCDVNKRPIPADGIFHEKAGIIADQNGDRIAWNGSLNETPTGWQDNWESINVYTSWGLEPGRVAREEDNFTGIWANKKDRVIVLDVPDAAHQDLMRFMPAKDTPARLKETEKPERPSTRKLVPEAEESERLAPLRRNDLRNRVWTFIRQAPALPSSGARVGEATAAVTPWPHQVRAFERLYGNWPPKLLIADEVGLGKTIQAGMLLRQAWLSGRAKRVLILAPKAVLKQWQVELREKFNLNWPIYDGGKLVWYPSPAWRGRNEKTVDRHHWHHEPAVIASSQLMRRQDRAKALIEEAEPWDLVVLDEAHHARRRAAGSPQEGGPNALLRLMQKLKERTQGLMLLTATPMQIHPVEIWDLLNLLGMPAEWNKGAFLGFFDATTQPNLTSETLERMAELFRSVERHFGKVTVQNAQQLTGLPNLRTKRVLRALRDNASIPRRQLETEELCAAVNIMRAHTPIRRLVSRHTRELLRRYYRTGVMTTPIANRQVEDRFLKMTSQEQTLYDTVEDYIASTYNQASADERTAVGFVMTIYRRRLSSSFLALRNTLQNRLGAITGGGDAALIGLDEDVPDDETMDEVLDDDEIATLKRKALVAEEESDIRHLLDGIDKLPPDSKLATLKDTLDELRRDGYDQAMVFTQYTDTMDFLRAKLLSAPDPKLMCFSGRGGEIPSADGSWRRIGRDEAKQRFRDGEANVLLCTEAAAEGLNFQFCGALINYDMPWNPMRVEQRIGRIDRLGQKHAVIRIVNLHYEGTIETDIYRALKSRISLFESVVGRLQPILAKLPRKISETVLSGNEQERANVVNAIAQEAQEAEKRGFDIDAVTEDNIATSERPTSPVTMDDLDRVIRSSDLMPPGTDVQPMRPREYSLLAPGMHERLRVTTDPEYFEEHAESMELWSPGNPLFPVTKALASDDEPLVAGSLKEVLDG